MDRIRSVAVLGAGALGVMYAQAMKIALGDCLYFLADGERYDRLRGTAFSVNGREERFAVRRSVGLDEKPDLLLVAVKNYDLPGLAPAIGKIAGPGTIVVSVLNGIDSEPILEEAAPDAAVLYCCVLGMDAVKDGSKVSFSTRGKILLGTKDKRNTPELEAATEFFKSCGLACENPADIHRSLWWKWMVNIGLNQVSAVALAPYGALQTDAALLELAFKAMREVIALAQAEGVALGEADIDECRSVLMRLGADGKTSMLQDMENRRKTEVEVFSGKLLQMCARRGISAPVNDVLYRVISARERMFAAEGSTPETR